MVVPLVFPWAATPLYRYCTKARQRQINQAVIFVTFRAMILRFMTIEELRKTDRLCAPGPPRNNSPSPTWHRFGPCRGNLRQIEAFDWKLWWPLLSFWRRRWEKHFSKRRGNEVERGTPNPKKRREVKQVQINPQVFQNNSCSKKIKLHHGRYQSEETMILWSTDIFLSHFGYSTLTTWDMKGSQAYEPKNSHPPMHRSTNTTRIAYLSL